MTGREWKPGDVAFHDKYQVTYIRRRDGLWNGVDQYGETYTDRSMSDSALRPLVVIDPEDREQVERLDDIYQRALDAAPAFHSLADVMQAALREFANPTPLKPDEPMGLGAVVEDADGRKWVRADADGIPWHHVVGAGDNDDWRQWSSFAAVRVLSEGVTP